MSGEQASSSPRNLEACGFAAWFETDLGGLAAVLAELAAVVPPPEWSPRARFLAAAAQLGVPPEAYVDYCAEFAAAGDREGEYAAVGAAVLTIWNSGADVGRYAAWHERAVRLLADREGVSALAVAALLGSKGLMELTGDNDLAAAARTYEECLQWCEKSESVSLWVFQASMLSYCYLWRGELSRSEILLADTAPLAAQPTTNVLATLYFSLTRALLYALQGKVERGKSELRAVAQSPIIGMAPAFIMLFSFGHLLFALAQEGGSDEVEALAEKIRHLAIPERNHFHHSYLHFCLAIVANLLGQPAKGLLHGEQAVELGRKSGSAIAARMPALVVGQSLADLGEHQRALAHLSAWVVTWQACGYDYFAASAQMEMAAVLVRLGELDRARRAFEQAEAIMPRGEGVPHLLRPATFVDELRRRLFGRPARGAGGAERAQYPVQIETFGDLCITLGAKQVYDRNWLGNRTKTLLKALVVLGGDKVPTAQLADLLWPDSDADEAQNNLKVALSRLRKLGGEESRVPWVVVRHQRVSLPEQVCFVDCFAFDAAIRTATAAKNIDELAGALDLYTADFLSKDTTEPWIVRHRELLRTRFVRGVATLAEAALAARSPRRVVAYLERALEVDPTNEDLYALLIDAHLALDAPSQAARTFNRAEAVLRRELGTAPGQRLRDAYRRAIERGVTSL